MLPGQAMQFQVTFTATQAMQFADTITLNTGTPDRPHPTRLKVKAKVVAPGSTIAGTWYDFGYAQFPRVVNNVGPNLYEATWTGTDMGPCYDREWIAWGGPDAPTGTLTIPNRWAFES